MISVIIPSYNRAERIAASAKSVLNQTYKDIELIIVDDGSTDNTKEAVDALNDERVRYIYQENAGACAARNNGIDHANGDYIAFQDSDDEWLPDKLEIQLNTLLKTGADVCFCQMHRHGYDKKEAEYHPNIRAGFVEYRDFLTASLVSTQTIFARKAVLDNVRFDTEIKIRQDHDWIIRAAQNYKIYFIDKPLVEVYLQNDSIGAVKNHNKQIDTMTKFYKKYKPLFREYPEFQIYILNKLGESKTMMNQSSFAEYKKAYQVSGNKKYLLKSVMAKTRILHLYFAVKKKLGK